VIGDGVTDGFQYCARFFWGHQEVTTPFATANFLNRASKIDVHDIMPEFNQHGSTAPHFVGVRSHYLPGNRVVFEPMQTILTRLAKTALFSQNVRIFSCAPFSTANERAVEQGFGYAVRAAMTSGDQTHRCIRVASKASLKEGCIKAMHGRWNSIIDRNAGCELR
jgi:hypothetical protein